MKAKSIIIGIIVALCAGVGIFLFVRSHHAAAPPAAGDEANSPPVISVQVGTLKRVTLHHYIEAYGSVEPAPATPDQPAAGAALAPSTSGVVARVNVVEGQAVKKGDLLIVLDAGTVSADYAQQEVARQQKLYEQHNTSLKALQDAQAQIGALRVVAPLSGTVTRLNARPGQAVDVNTVVAELVDLDRLAVRADVPASDVNEIKVGDAVQVLAKPPATATVSFISPAVDTNNNTVAVRGILPANSGLRPGQFVPLHIVTAVHTNCLAAPEQSVVKDLEGHSIIALVNGDEAIQTPVQTGFQENGRVEVAGAGLKEGSSVVTMGAYGLPDKTNKIDIPKPAVDENAATNSSTSEGQ
jgi:membrane fusion protein (multidrug efflux system)